MGPDAIVGALLSAIAALAVAIGCVWRHYETRARGAERTAEQLRAATQAYMERHRAATQEASERHSAEVTRLSRQYTDDLADVLHQYGPLLEDLRDLLRDLAERIDRRLS